MAQIGTLGNIIFETSTEKIQTFKDFNRSSTAKLATHEIIGKKPIVEFLSPDLEQVSFVMQLKNSLGVEVEELLRQLREMRDTGKIVDLIINGEPLIKNKWIIESLSESVTNFDGQGKMVNVDVSIALKEYVDNKPSDKEGADENASN